MSERNKWAEKLSAKCGVSDAFLKIALDELSESCYGDAKTSQEILEELTLSCHMDESEMRRFIEEVSKNCPFDAKKLRDEVAKAGGKKDNVFQSISKAGQGAGVDRTGVR